jgi:hypothetical protein
MDPEDFPTPTEDVRFRILKAQADAHWSRYLPKRYAQLEQSGELENALIQAAEMAVMILHQCERAGLNPDQGRELAMPGILLPEESDWDEEAAEIPLCQSSENIRKGMKEMAEIISNAPTKEEAKRRLAAHVRSKLHLASE